MRRTRRSGAGASGVAGLAVVGTLLVGCGTDEAAADAVLEGRGDRVDGPTTTFVVPTGTLAVTIGDPVDRVGSDDTADREERAAPDGSALLPVLVDFTDREGAPWGGRLAAEPQEADVALEVDGEERRLGSPYTTTGRGLSGAATATYWVVVPGEPAADDVTVTVTYDGAEQAAVAGAEPSGPGAALAALPQEAPAAADCPERWRTDGAPLRLECELPLVGRTPYWPGAGWAADGSSWVVVEARRVQAYAARGSADEVRSVEGVGAAEQLDHGEWGPTGLAGVVVAGEDDLVDEALPLELDVEVDAPGAETGPVRASHAVPVPR
ncbi:hypothetical protein [Nocardioides deserti]|uniref:Uncharacterized protein n=1 Tax=Nocardioides deserti TaxID=1588644 RepID=A0ABR6U890_9ACTN|nr:hypothetical protein [Nocardioides deserti]MBC2960662.1 hypothetical protein [Nocardioides deserti]